MDVVLRVVKQSSMRDLDGGRMWRRRVVKYVLVNSQKPIRDLRVELP